MDIHEYQDLQQQGGPPNAIISRMWKFLEIIKGCNLSLSCEINDTNLKLPRSEN